jgi:predicted TIM-barrel fold metal-dependent hydrolase
MDHDLLRYQWLEPGNDLGADEFDISAIQARRYWADDFVAETRLQDVGRVVHVQAATSVGSPVAETSWLQTFADRLDVPHGVVAYCDLAEPTARAILRAQAEFGFVCGIRDLRYDDFFRNADWRRGYALVEEFGFVVCAAPELGAMSAASDLALAVPGVTLCIDHCGMPRRRDTSYFREWRAEMGLLASAPNTVVKISGLGMHDHRWTIESIRDWVLTCIELWGPERAFFGTNWPIDRLFSSYGDVLAAYWEIISEFSVPERESLFHGTADRVFGLRDRAT